MVTSNLTPELSLPMANIVVLLVGVVLCWYFIKDVILSEYRIKLYTQCGTRSHSIFVVSNCVYLVSGMTLLGLAITGLTKGQTVDYNTLVIWFSASIVALIARVRESDKLDCKLSHLNDKCGSCPSHSSQITINQSL